MRGLPQSWQTSAEQTGRTNARLPASTHVGRVGSTNALLSPRRVHMGGGETEAQGGEVTTTRDHTHTGHGKAPPGSRPSALATATRGGRLGHPGALPPCSPCSSRPRAHPWGWFRHPQARLWPGLCPSAPGFWTRLSGPQAARAAGRSEELILERNPRATPEAGFCYGRRGQTTGVHGRPTGRATRRPTPRSSAKQEATVWGAGPPQAP